MPFVCNEGSRIYWRVQGAPGLPWLILLHSIGTDMALYDRAAPYLERDFRLLRIDIRGHGASDAPAADYSLELLANDVLAVMDAACVERAVVCGISLGGMIAMQLAIIAPARVTGLALACTSAAMSPQLWPERIATVRESGVASVADGWVERHFSEAFVETSAAQTETVLAGMKTMSTPGYIGAAAAIRDMAVLENLPRIAVPTVVIAGELDVATPYGGHGDRIVAAIPGAYVEMLPTGHLACVEQPERFAGCVAALGA